MSSAKSILDLILEYAPRLIDAAIGIGDKVRPKRAEPVPRPIDRIRFHHVQLYEPGASLTRLPPSQQFCIQCGRLTPPWRHNEPCPALN